MLVAVAGPYSAPTAEARQKNLDAMSRAAIGVYQRGHVPLIGVHAARDIVEMLPDAEQYDAMMEISLALVERCDAILMIGESPGANRERDLVASLGRPVYSNLNEVPWP